MPLLIISKTSQLSLQLQSYLPIAENIYSSSQELDITNEGIVKQFFHMHSNISCIINAAAYTAVDKAESEPEACFAVNDLGVKNLVIIARSLGVPIIHISTDYVFDGNGIKPYTPKDETNPLTVYGKSKLAGEQHVLSYKKGYVIRTSWLYSEFKSNFVKTIQKISRERKEINVVNDQIGSPTYAKDLAEFICFFQKNLDKAKSNLYHFCNLGDASWYEFAQEILKFSKIDCKVNSVGTSEYPTPATRPKYSILDTSQVLSDFNYEIRNWQEALKECITKTS